MENEDIDIDSILDEIESEEKEPTEKDISIEKNLQVEKKNTEIDVTEAESIANELVSMTIDDRKMADQLFQLFYPELANGRDKTTASKEAIARALELRINAGKNMIDLLKIIKGGEKNGNSVGVFFGETMSSKKAGINISNIQEELKD